MKKIINYIKNLFKQRAERKALKKKLEDIKKNDPFIYK